MSLPTALSSFIGRETEAAAVSALLDGARLVTLTGPAGIGKTRLALEAAHRAAAATPRDPVWADLAPLGDPALLAARIAAAAAIREEGVGPPDQALVTAFRKRATLLVLDNCEHLIAACAELATSLLRACPELTVLATSREPLGVAGERVWPVPPLSRPAAGASRESALESEALRLFVARAQEVLPSFRLTGANLPAVIQICRRLDGLPLAVELAAARIRVLDPGQIASRLDDAFGVLGAAARGSPSHHRTLRTALDWSHALLGAREQRLLRRLGVFPSTFGLEAVEAVCPDDAMPRTEVLDLLSLLVEKSWVTMEAGDGEARYRLLEVIRQYAAVGLRESGEEAALRARHAAHYLAVAESAEPECLAFGPPAVWSTRFLQEAANLEAAADWFEAAPDGAGRALRLACVMYWHHFAQGQWTGIERRLTTALVLDDGADPLLRARAQTALAFVRFGRGDAAGMRAPLADSLSVLRRQRDPSALAYALIGQSLEASLAGRWSEVDALLAEAVAIGRAHGLTLMTALALYWQGSRAWSGGDLLSGRATMSEAIRLVRCCRQPAAVAHASTRCGILALLHGDHATALSCFGDALAALPPAHNRWGAVQILMGLAGVAAAQGRPDRGARLLGAAEAECARMSVAMRPDLLPLRNRIADALGGALGPRFVREHEAGRGLALDEALALAAGGAEPRAPAAAAVPECAPDGGWPLEVRALGSLEILRDGVPVPLQAWHAARPRELLLFLLCHPGGATRPQLGLVFWPEAAPAQLKNGFHVALHYLRRALGRSDLVVFERDRYRVSWELGVEFDAARFEAAVAQARRAERAAALGLLDGALARWRGEFLEDAGAGDWHLEHRDRLRRCFQDALLLRGSLLEREARQAEALEGYHRLLRADPLHEEACRRLMRCHARLGDRTEALRQYERLATRLRAELEVEPDPETRALRELIRRGAPL